MVLKSYSIYGNDWVGHMTAALVTGSTSGIGLATARKLNALGYDVTLHGRTPRTKLDEDLQSWLDSSPSRDYVQADLSEEHAPRTLVEATLARWDGLDLLVSNAAVTLHKESSDTSASEWDYLYQVNVRAAFLLGQAARDALAKSRGSAVFVSSTNARKVNRKNLAYDSSKAALNHLARGMALEWRELGIRVNVVMPGGTQSPMLKSWLVDFAGDETAANKVLRDGVKENTIAAPEDIVGAIVFLGSPEAHWISGAVVPVDGGLSLEG